MLQLIIAFYRTGAREAKRLHDPFFLLEEWCELDQKMSSAIFV